MKGNAGMQEKNTGGANDELSQVGNLSVKRTRTEKILAFIACFIAAFFIWYYAADHDTAVFEESFSSVPVEIVNGSGFRCFRGAGSRWMSRSPEAQRAEKAEKTGYPRIYRYVIGHGGGKI